MKIILASGSPRRHRLLSEKGIEFDIMIPEVKEDFIKGESPSEHVKRLSKAKAMKIAVDCPGDLVIGSDTIVVLEKAILGKPHTKKEAFEMLKRLSGKTHTVFTGLSLLKINDNIVLTDYDSTDVVFNKVSDEQINKYIETEEPLDKAGSYGIQGMGSFLVSRYNGELDTVIGFPTKLFENMYQEVLAWPRH